MAVEQVAAPGVLAPVAEGIPEALRALRRWICWEAELRDGKLNKLPRSPRDGQPCKWRQERAWGTWAEALATARRRRLAGVGIVLDETLGLVGIDLDHCIDDGGCLSPAAAAIVARMGSYAERTPSGTGVRVFALGTLPRRGAKKGDVEMYSGGRFLTVTGCRLEGAPATVERREAELTALWSEHFSAAPARQRAERAPPVTPRPDLPPPWDGQTAPPVPLLARDLPWWQGERDKRREGRRERSGTLYAIACGLARGGATEEQIVAAVAARDGCRGFQKYIGRDDAWEQYQAIARRALDEVGAAAEEVPALPLAAGAEGLVSLLWLSLMENVRLQRDLAAHAARSRAVFAVLSNPRLAPLERIVGARVPVELAALQSHQAEGEDGFVRLPQDRVVDLCACSRQRGGDVIERFRELGVLEKRIDRRLVEVTDEATGESCHVWRSEQYLRLVQDLDATLTAVAELAPPETPRPARPPAPPPLACPDHPGAGIVERVITTCAVCGQLLGQDEPAEAAAADGEAAALIGNFVTSDAAALQPPLRLLLPDDLPAAPPAGVPAVAGEEEPP